MNLAEQKERATFSLSPSVKNRLEEVVPKNKRSRFVEKAIEKALRDEARGEFMAFLDTLPKPSGGETSTEVLRRLRQAWDGRPIGQLEGRRD
jgi:hypothetical protein